LTGKPAVVDDHAELGVAPLRPVMSSLNIVHADDPDLGNDSLAMRMSSISGLPRIKVSTIISGHPRSDVGRGGGYRGHLITREQGQRWSRWFALI
jgi:hypothetical protein